jgi:hypothetical protein
MQDAGTRPEYVIPVGSAAGVWAMVKSLGRFRGEGWLSLWKGGAHPPFHMLIFIDQNYRSLDILHP